MADDWVSLQLVTECAPPSGSGTIKLPKSTAKPSKKRILVEACNGDGTAQADAKAMLFKVDVRADGGAGACATPADFQALGLSRDSGEDHPYVRYRPIGLGGSLLRDGALVRALLTAVLTLIATFLAIVTAFESDTSSTAGDITSFVAPFVMGIATVLAGLRFCDDWTSL